MPATFEWYNAEKTIMYEQFAGDWTWHDFSDCIKGATDLIREVSHDAIAISDYTDSTSLPMSGASLKMARDVMLYAPDNWKGVIIVSNNRLTRAMVNLFQNTNRSFGDQVYLEATLDAAVIKAQNILIELNSKA